MSKYLGFCRSAGAIWLLLLTAPVLASGSRAPQELSREYGKLRQRFAESLPGWCPAAPATGLLLFIAPDQYSPTSPPGQPFGEDRKKYADALFELAQKAVDAGQLSLAFQYVTQAVRENPDHQEGRLVLGYQERNGRWLTPYGARMADAGRAWHPKYGWIGASDLPRYEAGERFADGRWITSGADIARHRDLKNGWQLRSDHFLLTTNHSLEAAAELAARLERLHQVWRQLFAGFYLSESEVRRLFAGERAPRRQARPFRVYYYRDKGDYAAALERRQPRIRETLGIYFDTDREAHFFAADDQDQGTLYHEAAHQLFQETGPTGRQIGKDRNFWVIEGVATYMETLTEHADSVGGRYYTIGESTAGRLPAARQRLKDGFYVPLAELTRLGKDAMQQHPEIAKLYSQSAGLTAFLMQAHGGRFREPLVRYLKAVYAGRDDAESLPAATGQHDDELDAQYRDYWGELAVE